MRRFVIVLLLCAGAARAAAPPSPLTEPITFALVRGGASECAPDCPEWIAAQGRIDPGAARRFQAFLDGLDGRRRPVLIDSPGGSVDDALAMGRLIRARKLAVAVAVTRQIEPQAGGASTQTPKLGHADSYPAFCASACTLVLAGGVERYASPFALVGVHQTKGKQARTFVLRHYLVRYRIIDGRKEEISRQEVSEDRNTVTTDTVNPAVVNARIAAYLKEMGEDVGLVALMESATPESLHRLTPEEETQTRLVTIFIPQPSAMDDKPPFNGLSGDLADPASPSNVALEAQAEWTLEPDAAGRQRAFTAHFRLQRGGGGVAATFAALEVRETPLIYGFAPDVPGLSRWFENNARRMEAFLPNALFCRLAASGEVFVARAERAPTYVPGLPDASAPLLRQPVSQIHGLKTLTDEVCPNPTGRERARAGVRSKISLVAPPG